MTDQTDAERLAEIEHYLDRAVSGGYFGGDLYDTRWLIDKLKAAQAKISVHESDLIEIGQAFIEYLESLDDKRPLEYFLQLFQKKL